MDLFQLYSEKKQSSHGSRNAKEAGYAVIELSATVWAGLADGLPRASANMALQVSPSVSSEDLC